MARSNNKKTSVNQLSFDQLSLDMTSSTTTPGSQNDEGNPESFAEVSAASEVLAQDELASDAIAKAHEALDDLRGLAAQVDSAGLINEKKPDEAAPAAPEIQAAAPEALLSQILQKKQDDAKPHDAKQAPSAKQKVGEQLRAARLAGQFAIEDIAAEIKIKTQHLLAIEESRFGDLPSRTYAVGFVRAYASTLGLDVDALVADCRREVALSMPQKQPQMIMPEAVAEQPLPSSSLVVMTAALAFLLSAVGYVFTRDTVETAPIAPPAISQTSEQKPVASQAAQQPVQAQPQVQPQQVQPQIQPQLTQQQQQMQQQAQQPVVQAVPHEEPAQVDTAVVDTTHVSSGFLQKGLVAPNPTAPGVAGKAPAPSRIKLKAVDETTVQIFDASGRMIAERVINKGEAFYVPDKAGLTLATTNAGALHMQIDGREMQPLGDPDEAMHNIPLNADSLLKYLQ